MVQLTQNFSSCFWKVDFRLGQDKIVLSCFCFLTKLEKNEVLPLNANAVKRVTTFQRGQEPLHRLGNARRGLPLSFMGIFVYDVTQM
jgi:hypothetical protein